MKQLKTIYSNETDLCVIYFKIYFQNYSPSSFFKLWLSLLLLNIQNNENNYEGSGRSEKENKSYLITKKNLAKGHSFMTSAKKSRNQVHHPHPLSIDIQFWSELTPLVDVFNWHSIPPLPFPRVISEFPSKKLTMRST